MINEIKIGSVVKLNGGDSPIMNVNKELENDMVECVWFNGSIVKKDTFSKKILFDYELEVLNNEAWKKELEGMTVQQLERMMKKATEETHDDK